MKQAHFDPFADHPETERIVNPRVVEAMREFVGSFLYEQPFETILDILANSLSPLGDAADATDILVDDDGRLHAKADTPTERLVRAVQADVEQAVLRHIGESTVTFGIN